MTNPLQAARKLIRTDDGVVEIDLTHPHGPRVVFPETLARETVSKLCAPLAVDFACGIQTMGCRFIAAPIVAGELVDAIISVALCEAATALRKILNSDAPLRPQLEGLYNNLITPRRR